MCMSEVREESTREIRNGNNVQRIIGRSNFARDN